MALSTIVFQNTATSKGLKFRFWSFLRKGILRVFDDPICRMPVHGRVININLSHDLPLYQARHPYYDTLPARLAHFLRRRNGHVVGIDVGANIGDSLVAFVNAADDQFLAIEPNLKFFQILQSNWKGDPRVIALPVLCSAIDEVANVLIIEKRGTASVVKSAAGNGIQQRTIDSLVIDYSFLSSCNLIKIDTDGHDFEVLDGAMVLIGTTKPAILFECDVFGRDNYTERIAEVFQKLNHAGYGGFLLYDNFGHLMGRYLFGRLENFFHLIFYQLSSAFHYFDILVLADEDLNNFHVMEIDFFTQTCVDSKLRRTALTAAMP